MDAKFEMQNNNIGVTGNTTMEDIEYTSFGEVDYNKIEQKLFQKPSNVKMINAADTKDFGSVFESLKPTATINTNLQFGGKNKKH
jgi:hypothetical protein